MCDDCGYPKSFTVPRGARVVLWGDSLTATHLWWDRFVQGVNKHYAGGTGVTFLNSGRGAATVGDLVPTVDVVNKAATHVILFVGINDVFFGVDPAVTRSDYNAKLDGALAGLPSVQFLLMTPWLSGEARPNGAGPKDTQVNAVRDIVLDIASERSMPVVNVRDLFYADTRHDVIDTPGGANPVHPNTNGQAWLSERVSCVVALDA